MTHPQPPRHTAPAPIRWLLLTTLVALAGCVDLFGVPTRRSAPDGGHDPDASAAEPGDGSPSDTGAPPVDTGASTDRDASESACEPEPEVCDGQDQDCDGRADEGLSPPPCGDFGVCATARATCMGAAGWQCADLDELPGYEPEEIRCDGIDEDCDGAVDELARCCAVRGASEACGGVGICAGDRRTCGEEAPFEWGPCDSEALRQPWDPGDPDLPEACANRDGLDNDCDGAVDEDPSAPPAAVQAGVCAGRHLVCDAGQWREPDLADIPTYSPVELCDDLDNDCDGRVDEDLPGCDVDCDGEDDDDDGLIDESRRCDVTVCGPAAHAPPCNGCPADTRVPLGWVCVPPGEFDMGAPDPGHPEGPQRRVRITRALLLQETEVTRSAWRALTEGDSFAADCRFDDDVCPADNLNFYDAAWYANVLSDAHALERCYDLQRCSGAVGVDLECDEAGFGGLDCEGYRLPTEAEWEYSARAGSRTRFAHGDDVCRLVEYACYRDALDDLEPGCERADPPRDGATVCAVGLRRANDWGAFDMHGNLWEWTNDAYEPYPAAQAEDPVVPPGAENVHRGGSFSSPNGRSTVYARGANGSSAQRATNIGFRLVRTVPPAEE